ncbi:helix-turn-helix domain-containing protein [Bradyrhizobium sp. STM 3566]|uniref:helix-turn-helix domain-containing protein n=1 Tax=Bradyrhizobium sp. STM 3566 TaxID=578928 RepID=UPI0038903773
MITGAQIRAARSFLKWTAAELAKKAGIGISTVQEIEKIDGEPRVESSLQWRSAARDEAIEKIQRAFVDAGISFLKANEQGIGIRGRLDGSRIRLRENRDTRDSLSPSDA